jgi:hypothetical protein
MTNFKLTAITPQHMPTTAEYLKALKDSVYKTASLAQRDLASTVKTWDHKVAFDVTITQQGNDYIVAAGTDDKRYLWIDEGTGIYGPKHQAIKPKRSKYFRFQVGGQLKTRSNYIGSFSGTPNTQWVTVTEIKGIPKRNFIKIIQKRRQKTIEQEASQSLAKIARTQR